MTRSTDSVYLDGYLVSQVEEARCGPCIVASCRGPTVSPSRARVLRTCREGHYWVSASCSSGQDRGPQPALHIPGSRLAGQGSGSGRRDD